MAFTFKPESERVSGATVLISVPLELRRRVEREARRTDTSLSEIGRRALTEFFDEEAGGIGSGGDEGAGSG